MKGCNIIKVNNTQLSLCGYYDNPRYDQMKLIIIILTISIILTTLVNQIIALPYSNVKSYIRLFLNWATNVTSASALVMSALATFQTFRIHQILKSIKNNNNYDEPKYRFYTLTSFTLGLVLWFIAELSWTQYELGLGIENPFPSPADAIWLAGYPFIIYFLFGISKGLSKQEIIYDREPIILVSVATALTLAYVFTFTYGIADIISNQQDISNRIITIIYPILDGIAFVPSILIIAKLWNKKRVDSIGPWILLAGSILLITVADLGFGYSEVLGKTVEEGRVGIWDAIYSAGYIVVAVSMNWQYHILSTRKIQLLKTLK